MSSVGQRMRFIGMSAPESPYGTANYASDPSDAAEFVWLPVVTESITESQEYIDVQAGAARELRRKVPGPWKVTGDFTVMFNGNMHRLLEAVCGTSSEISKTTNGGVSSRVFRPQVGFNGYTLHVYAGRTIDGNTIGKSIAGTIIKEIAFEAPAREVLTAKCAIIGHRSALIEMGQIASDYGDQLQTTRPFLFYEGHIDGTLASDATADNRNFVEALRWTHTNELHDDLFTLGTRWYRGDADTGPLNVTGEMDISFKNWALYKKFYGDTTKNVPIAELDGPEDATLYSLTATFTGIATGNGTYPNVQLVVYMPSVILDSTKASFNERERIVYGVTFTALFNQSLGSCVQYTIVSSDSAD